MDICKRCGNAFTPRRSGGRQQLFCSRHCAKTFHNVLNNAKRLSGSTLAAAMSFGRMARTRPIPEDEQEIIFGTLLGDGSLIGRGHKRLSMTHCAKQLDYLLWKVSLLPSIFSRQSPNECKGGGFGGGTSFAISSVWHPFFDRVHSLLYSEGKKRISAWVLNHLTPRALAIWYQDDGSFMRDPRAQQAVFCTDGFTLDEVEMLADRLFDIGLRCGIYRSKEYHRIYVSRKSIDDLFSMIRPYVHPSMAYKIR